MELSQTDVGYIAVAISILFFGSFGLPLKSKRVQEAAVDPVVFQLYYSLAIFITSWIACIYQPFVFDYHGILAALLWVPASILSIFAINYIGLSIAQGLWSGVTIVVSFCWGLILQHTKLKVAWAVLSMSFLLIGIVLIANCKNRYFFGAPVVSATNTTSTQRLSINETAESPVDASPETPLVNAPDTQPTPPKDNKKILGLVCAFALGILNGSMLIPTLNLSVTAYQFIPNFGIGALLVTPVFAIVYFAAFKAQFPDFKLKQTAPAGLIAGVLWNIGNAGSVVATAKLSLAVGFPLSQLALLVAGFWGLSLFNELPHTIQKGQFLVSAIVLLFGAFCLLMAGRV